MEELAALHGTIIDLPALSANFPPPPSPELLRENVVNTIDKLLEQHHGVAVEGPEGAGKTTSLAQFARAHPTTAFSLFISAANRLSSDPDLIRMDLAKQVHWVLTNDVLRSGDYNPSLLKQYYSDLHREARRKKILFFFIVDGLDELPGAEQQTLLQHFSDLLPTGNHQFRFLFAGDVKYFNGLISKPFEAKSYPLTDFSIEEAQFLFDGQAVSPAQLKEIRALCHGSPGRMASVSRSIRFGADAQAAIDEVSSGHSDFFSADWRQVPESDDDAKRILAVLAHDAKPHTPSVLAEILKLEPSAIENKLRTLNFISIDPETRQVHFASAGLREFIATKLADKKQYIHGLLIKRLLSQPQSSESLMDLPEHLENAAQFADLLNLLTPEHLVSILEKTQTLSKVEDVAKRGFRSAKRLKKDNELLRFSIQNAVIHEFSRSSVWVSEIEALAALGKEKEALALANNATLIEDRLQLLAAFANAVWMKSGTIDRELREQLKILIDRIDPRSVGRRAREIAEQLVCPSPDLATALLDRISPTLPDEDDLDRLFVSLSVRALRELKDERVRGEVIERFALKHKDSKTRSSLKGFRVLTGRLSAAEVLPEAEALELPDAKIRVLRAWCMMNATQPDADTVTEYALNLALGTTAYTLDASLLADLSSPLPSTKSPSRCRSLIGSFDGLRGTAERLGPSVDYVRLQLSLASAEFEIDQSAAERRLSELFDYVVKIEDLSSKGEAFARLLSVLKVLGSKHYLLFGSSLEKQCLEQLEGAVLSLIYSTADQYTAIAGIVRAMADSFLAKALEYVSLANTEGRRDALSTDIVEALVHRPVPEVDIDELLTVLGGVRGQDARDRTLEAIMERFDAARDITPACVDGLDPVFSMLAGISDSVMACRALVQALNLLTRHEHARREDLRKKVFEQLRSRWELIDVGWIRIDTGFAIAKDLAATCLVEANVFLVETEALKEGWSITANRPASAYVACIRLAIQCFAGLLPKRLETDHDVQSLAALIDVLPSFGERAVLWSDVCMRGSLVGRQDMAERLSRDFLQPILDKIPAGDTAYRAGVLINTAPAVHKVSPLTCTERLDSIGPDQRDSAIRQIIRYLINGRVPNDPHDDSHIPDREVSYETLLEIVSLVKKLDNDWMIYATSREVADMFHATRKHYRVNLPQREDISRRFTEIAKEQLPISRQIQHMGFQIITLAQALRMGQAKQGEWGSTIKEARALENIADKAFVLETVALCLPTNMAAERDKLFAEARLCVEKIPSDLDQIERFIGFAEDIRKSDAKLCRELITAAASVLGHTSEDVASQRRRLVDVAFRVDESVATALIDKFDDDDAKKSARGQVKLLKLREEINDENPGTAVSHVESKDLRRFGWLLLKALNSGRIQTFHPSAVRDYLEAAANQPLRTAFPTLLWYVENAVVRFSNTDQAVAFLRPMFDATVVGAKLAGQIAGSTLTRLKAVRLQSGAFGTQQSMLVRPGSRDEAMKAIGTWCEKNLSTFVKLADPYFSPSDLEWLQLIRAAKPNCEITVLTGRASQPSPAAGQELEDVYVNAWRQAFDQQPPRTKIAVIGTESGRQSPIHDRWLVTESAGLRLGTSLNSLGLAKESEISEMSAADAEQKLNTIDQYLNRERTEHNGEKLRLTIFYL